jgi:deoxyribose-phosphate aldolase
VTAALASALGGSHNAGVNRRKLARLIEHTCLRPDATARDIDRLCDEARDHGVGAVCVPPVRIEHAVRRLSGSGIRVVSVAGFPHGATPTRLKAAEARAALEAGASEVDMVMAIGAFKEGDDGLVEEDIATLAGLVHGASGRLKVILETGFLDPDEVARACRIAERAGADFVKTSTGFGPPGASIETVRRMRASVSLRVGVKAAGGIRDYATAVALIEAGASRIGASATVAILSGAPEVDDRGDPT